MAKKTLPEWQWHIADKQDFTPPHGAVRGWGKGRSVAAARHRKARIELREKLVGRSRYTDNMLQFFYGMRDEVMEMNEGMFKRFLEQATARNEHNYVFISTPIAKQLFGLAYLHTLVAK